MRTILHLRMLKIFSENFLTTTESLTTDSRLTTLTDKKSENKKVSGYIILKIMSIVPSG